MVLEGSSRGPRGVLRGTTGWYAARASALPKSARSRSFSPWSTRMRLRPNQPSQSRRRCGPAGGGGEPKPRCGQVASSPGADVGPQERGVSPVSPGADVGPQERGVSPASPGADVGPQERGVSPNPAPDVGRWRAVPVQTWARCAQSAPAQMWAAEGRAQSRRRCGQRGGPSPGARAQSRRRCGRGEPSFGADVAADVAFSDQHA